jgi:SAM-dependent methyltransferase
MTHLAVSESNAPDSGPLVCQACGRTASGSAYLDVGQHRIRLCRACGLGTLVDPPDENALAALYQSDLYASARPRGIAVVQLAHRAVNAIRLGTLGHPTGRLLDVGCGKGHFLASARAAGWDAVGLEYAQSSADEAKARYGLDVIVADYMTASLGERFDAVTMWHVLEHLPDPLSAIERARSLLVDDGRLLISVPNLSSLQARIFGPDWLHLDLPRHLFHFTPRSLERLLERGGFRVERIDTFAPEMEVLGLVQSTLNRVGNEGNVALRFLKNDPTASASRSIRALAGAAIVLPAAVAWSAVAPLLGTGASVQVLARPA